jgi:hypothetical protein
LENLKNMNQIYPDTYILEKDSDGQPIITCKRCKKSSWNTGDIENRYCGFCKVFHDDLYPPSRQWWIDHPDQHPASQYRAHPYDFVSVYAWMSLDDNGEPGIVFMPQKSEKPDLLTKWMGGLGILGVGRALPLVATQKEPLISSDIPVQLQVKANALGKTVRLCRFVFAEEITVLPAAPVGAEQEDPRDPVVRIVHHLQAGLTPCGMTGVPKDWPEGHLWSQYWGEVSCPACLAARINKQSPTNNQQ